MIYLKWLRMIIRFYGTRGSVPACGERFLTYGGNTSCVAVDMGGQLFVIDAGTGIIKLGRELLQSEGPQVVNLLFTHFHWDHIQGLPFFEPCYNANYKINLHSIQKEKEALENALKVQMRECYFPIRFDQMKARFAFMELSHELISTIRLNHPGGCSGLKFVNNGKSIAYLVDHEYQQSMEQRFVDFCRGVDVLIHDGQYTPKEYTQYQGWGHSSYEQAIHLAQKAGVGRLIVTHHDPTHDDEFLSRHEIFCRESFDSFAFAREGMVIDLR